MPSDAEWTTLITYLGGEGVAGGKLKEAGNSHWQSPSAGTNSCGFTALPGGYRNHTYGAFFSMGYYGYWWSSSEYGAVYAWNRNMGYDHARVYRYDYNKNYGFGVRCVKD